MIATIRSFRTFIKSSTSTIDMAQCGNDTESFMEINVTK